MKLTNVEINRLVAEKIMGWNPDEYPAFRPVTDWADAGMVLDRLYSLGWYYNLRSYSRGQYYVDLNCGDGVFYQSGSASGNTPQLAIVLAALVAVRVITEDQI